MTRNAKEHVFAGKTVAQLEAMTKGLDREFVADSFRPMTVAERAQWERVKRKRGRPRIGKGAEVVSVSLERRLLAELDRHAKRLEMSRSQLLAAGFLRMLKEKAMEPGSQAKLLAAVFGREGAEAHPVRQGKGSKRRSKRAA